MDFTRSFEELRQNITALEQKVNNELRKLNNQINIDTIQPFSPLLLEDVSISVYTDWTNKKRINISFSTFIKSKLNLSDNVQSFDISPDGYQSALDFLDTIAELDKPTHQQNLAILAKNREILEAVIDFVQKAGIEAKYFGEIKVGRKRDWGWVEREWVRDIRRRVPLDYKESKLDSLLSSLKNRLTSIYEREYRAILEEERKRERETEKREATMKFAKLLVKYNLPDTTTSDELLEYLLKKNKYLFLAHYLHENRDDWSDGCWYAQYGLDFFRQHMDDPTDTLIYEEISEYINNWSDYGDGRIFRDCTWNYNKLYDMVKEQDPELYDDYLNCVDVVNKI